MKKPVIREELIGCKLTVVASPNKDLIGLTGKVVNETKHTFTVQTQNETKMVQKEQNTFAIECDHRKFTVEGNSLTKRPEEIK